MEESRHKRTSTIEEMCEGLAIHARYFTGTRLVGCPVTIQGIERCTLRSFTLDKEDEYRANDLDLPRRSWYASYANDFGTHTTWSMESDLESMPDLQPSEADQIFPVLLRAGFLTVRIRTSPFTCGAINMYHTQST